MTSFVITSRTSRAFIFASPYDAVSVVGHRDAALERVDRPGSTHRVVVPRQLTRGRRAAGHGLGHDDHRALGAGDARARDRSEHSTVLVLLAVGEAVAGGIPQHEQPRAA